MINDYDIIVLFIFIQPEHAEEEEESPPVH